MVFIDLIKWKANYIISFQSLEKSTEEKTPQILSAIPEYVIQNFPFCLKGYISVSLYHEKEIQTYIQWLKRLHGLLRFYQHGLSS